MSVLALTHGSLDATVALIRRCQVPVALDGGKAYAPCLPCDDIGLDNQARIEFNSATQLVQATCPAGGHETIDILEAYLERAAGMNGRDVSPMGDTSPVCAAAPRFRLLTSAEMASREPIAWLIEGELAAGEISTYFGPSGGGKSLVVLDRALRVALGHGLVVYIAAEGASGMAPREAAWRAHHRVDQVANIRYLPEAVQLRDLGDLTALHAALHELPDAPVLVVLDTLARCFVGGDENGAKDMGEFVAAVEKLRVAFGCGVILVHHSGVDTTRERGSTALRGASFMLAKVVPASGRGVRVTCEKMKDAEPFAALEYTITTLPPSATISPRTGPGLVGSEEREVMALLRDTFRSDPPTTNTLAAATELSKTKFFQVLGTLKTCGMVEGRKAGKTVRNHLTDKGLAALAGNESRQVQNESREHLDNESARPPSLGGGLVPHIGAAS